MNMIKKNPNNQDNQVNHGLDNKKDKLIKSHTTYKLFFNIIVICQIALATTINVPSDYSAIKERIAAVNSLDGNGESIFFSEYDNQQVIFTISAGLWGGVNPSVSSIGNLVTIEVVAHQVGEMKLIFDGSEMFRDLENNNNPIMKMVGGFITQ